MGEVLNTESLANDCGISVDTAKSWLSILGSSFIAFRLRPYFKNYGKRITKASKLYFYDTGLAAFAGSARKVAHFGSWPSMER